LWETFRYVKNGALKGKFSMCIEILFDMESWVADVNHLKLFLTSVRSCEWFPNHIMNTY
jgi:hypothetical protein